MRPKNEWTNAHIVLRRMWDLHAAQTGMSQEEFGERYGIGTQGMVSQYLLGTRPLNYDAAAKFARGFGCSIEDICPEMARTLVKDILPVLRRRLRRRVAASVFVAVGLAGVLHNQNSESAELRSAVERPYYALYLRLKRALLTLVTKMSRDCQIQDNGIRLEPV